MNCAYCSKEFSNAKRHAAHMAECRSNPRVTERKVAPVELDGEAYIRADDMLEFFPGAKNGRDALEMSQAPEDQRAFATLAPKRGVWTASTIDVKVARALVRAEWARKNVAGLEARLGGGGGGSSEGPATLTIVDIIDRLRLKEAELSCARAQVTLLSAQASERRAAEMHAKELEALERRTAAAIRQCGEAGGACGEECDCPAR